jgi:hypothetical protein
VLRTDAPAGFDLADGVSQIVGREFEAAPLRLGR